METDNQRNKRTVGAGGIILSLLLALVLAAIVLFGLWSWGNRAPAPESQRASSSEVVSSSDLWQDIPLSENEAPLPAEAPDALSDPSSEYTLGETVYEEDGLLVARIQGKRWRGLIALIEDPTRLRAATCPYFADSAHGRTVAQMADDSGALLAVNGGGFEDANGNGLGGLPIGNVFVDGEMRWGGYSATVGIDADGVMHAGSFSSAQCKELGLQWALSYGPTLIVDGVKAEPLDNSSEEPRTAVGQRSDGTVIVLCLSGRQASALGVTCSELADILMGYGAVIGGNLDGGASSDMYLNGEYINVRNASGYPRAIPTALLVMPKGGAAE